MARLDHKTIKHVVRATIRSGLERDALAAGIDAEFWSSLPNCRTNVAQYLRDVCEMNVVDALGDGSDPLAIWLGNALILAGQKPEAREFERALAAREQPEPQGLTGLRTRASFQIRRWRWPLGAASVVLTALLVWALWPHNGPPVEESVRRWSCEIEGRAHLDRGHPQCGAPDFETRWIYEVDVWATRTDDLPASGHCDLRLKVPGNDPDFGVYFMDQDAGEFVVTSHEGASPLWHTAPFARSCAQCTRDDRCRAMFAVCLSEGASGSEPPLSRMAQLFVDVDGRPEAVECIE